MSPLSAIKGAVDMATKADEAHADLKRVAALLEAVCTKLDALHSGIGHTGTDKTRHLGPAHPCPTCDRLEAAP